VDPDPRSVGRTQVTTTGVNTTTDSVTAESYGKDVTWNFTNEKKTVTRHRTSVSAIMVQRAQILSSFRVDPFNSSSSPRNLKFNPQSLPFKVSQQRSASAES
jgi:hypothetical protein